ncbi:MAG TPA: 5'-nucleotidase [Nitrospira sp.]|nr:5'-nucleotidase [Nitrospira sp.]
MTRERRFVIGVDLDGVCADFYGGLRPIAAEWLGVNVTSLPERVTWGLPEWGVDMAPGGYEALHRFAVTQRELFRVLPPMPGGPAALRKLSAENVRIRIITHRFFIKHFHQVAARQTIEWLDYHDIPYWDLCFMQEKAAVGADLYLEDSPRNVELLRSENLSTIVFTNSTNEDLPGPRANTWAEALELILNRKRDWEQQRH